MEQIEENQGLYNSSFEHDACGIGFVAHVKGRKSQQIISDAITILENLDHRGACGAEINTGDGAGIMIQVPHEFLYDECLKIGFSLNQSGDYGVGMLFLPKDVRAREECREVIYRAAEKLNLEVLGFRKVNTNTDGIGDMALSVEPEMEQVFVARPDQIAAGADFERKLYVFKNYLTKTILNTVKGIKADFYIASFSSRTIVYKGQLTSMQVRTYFTELSDKRVVSAFGLVHSRFATNTFPSWRLAQPFRYIAHNGEINTLQGNLNWFRASVKSFASSYFTAEELNILLPVIDETQSDSGCLDNIIELLLHAGRSLPHVLMMLIPEAWDGNEDMDELKQAFYKFHATLMEPWDGPAAIAFTDGNLIGATLDRNGLRPSRYAITKDDRVIMASESGVLALDQSQIIEKGRLTPGKMFVVDMEQGRIISDDEIKTEVCSRRPYADWLNQYQIRLEELSDPRVVFTGLSQESMFKYHQVFGYSREDIDLILKPMAIEAKEPIGSMGTDIPLAVLSQKPQHLSSYFKQLFAQVTNPPIDPIREKVVMSLAGFMGNNGNLLEEHAMQCHCVGIKHPILTNLELEKVRSIDTGVFQSKTLQTYFRADGKPGSLAKGLERLCRYAVDAVEDGFQVIVLSDRALDSEHAAIPSLMAVSAVHHHLIRKGHRGAVGIVVEAGDVWEVHHFACLIGFGATAVNPYLALETISGFDKESELKPEKLIQNYIYAVNSGLLKIFSKMGISTLQSYHGAQIFEILGIHKSVVDSYFSGAVSRIGGLGLDDIAREALIKHSRVFGKSTRPDMLLPTGGNYKWRRKGEQHLFNPQTIHLLQNATRKNDYNVYKQYSKLVNEQTKQAYTIRGLFEFNYNRAPVSLTEVEPVEAILKRFATGAMSFGSISHEAHSTLAIAMNRIGGKSNTGEGGEDELRYEILPNGDSMRSAIKQIASARFGVTSNYLTNADELQIKMAQGAKPGEGGQLPGHKVDDWIAKVRHATPGVGLISPPPHHDIYSIEDLAQLIFDLKNANRAARINVKLVSKAGVGTIAAGVAKAHADVILVSGFDGGTGASPLTSIQHAGLPWELGLAEAHQTLVKNRLRSRVVLQTDGQLKTGKDIAIAALLGAEEWGVATAALVTSGCIMMRKCHLNTCPVGVATQDPDLRKLFTGDPDHVVNLFHFLAEELRETMAELGFRTVEEMVGQADALSLRAIDDADWKLKNLDLSAILYKAPDNGLSLFNTESQDHGISNVLDHELIAASQPALLNKEPVFKEFEVKNTDRALGTMLSNEVSKIYKGVGLPPDTINFKFHGSAGQSFGAFAARGISLELEGEGNDYVGKGLSGARLSIYPFREVTYVPEQNIIIGNVALYGATSGELFVRGLAGERFAVRNSGATAVVEGLGDHGCEYMTGGEVLVLGNTGSNFAAGMSGGVAWIYDVNGDFPNKCNKEMVDLDPLNEEDELRINSLLKKHIQLTKSKLAEFILSDWTTQSAHFVKVFPKEYKAVLLKRSNKVKTS
ncbi:glutamate synthase large subunit [Pedobacter cryoconitis]|uniref:Glutamate synthase [NADPH] large chain n=1 Tax=Pedobacter cryoconitis TaxID=188932 RepID=A0A327SMM0_9SPHI|nr:glutamate synthase large subunit [Pedobacter cryoconitis]RAJ30209.1 glutamate synthase (NADPH/NADH) large chain [Pedobacter cryoconitis]